MALFYFNLNTGRQTIVDAEGTDLPDETAARSHAQTVARDIVRNDRSRTFSWRVEVFDEQRRSCFEVLLVSASEELKYLPNALREGVTHSARRVASLNDDIHELRHSLRQVRATLARADGMPYLAAVSGKRVDHD